MSTTEKCSKCGREAREEDMGCDLEEVEKAEKEGVEPPWQCFDCLFGPEADSMRASVDEILDELAAMGMNEKEPDTDVEGDS